MHVFVYLLSSVNDVLGVGQPVDTGPSDHRVVPRGGMGHLHGTELQEGLPQGDPTEQHLPESPDDRTRHIQKAFTRSGLRRQSGFSYLWHR